MTVWPFFPCETKQRQTTTVQRDQPTNNENNNTQQTLSFGNFIIVIIMEERVPAPAPPAGTGRTTLSFQAVGSDTSSNSTIALDDDSRHYEMQTIRSYDGGSTGSSKYTIDDDDDESTSNHRRRGQGDEVMLLPVQMQEKVGTICCGCFDYRRAVIYVNLLFVVIALITILNMKDDNLLIQDLDTIYDDDVTINDTLNIIERFYSQRVIFLYVAIFTSILAILGAVSFNIYFVTLHAVWMTIDLISFVIFARQLYDELSDRGIIEDMLDGSGTTGSTTYETIEEAEEDDDIIINPFEPIFEYPEFFFKGLIVACYLYPHIGFISEVKSGILNADTYPREQYACCCPHHR